MIFDQFRNKIEMEIFLIVFKIFDLNNFVNMRVLIWKLTFKFSFFDAIDAQYDGLDEYENEM